MMMALAGLPATAQRARPRRRHAAARARARTRARSRRWARASRTGRSPSRRPPSWGAARARRRAAAASSSARPRPRRWSARPWACRCRTRRWPRRASRSGSTRPGARPAPLVALADAERTVRDILTPASVRNAMARARRLRRLDEPAPARSGHRARGRAPSPDGRGLDRGQPPRAAAGQTCCRTVPCQPSDGAGVPGRGRAGGDAAPAAPGPARHERPDRHRPHARREPGLVGASRNGGCASASSCASATASTADEVDLSRRRRPARAASRARSSSRAATSPPRARW